LRFTVWSVTMTSLLRHGVESHPVLSGKVSAITRRKRYWRRVIELATETYASRVSNDVANGIEGKARS
jgi:hypothetical protein